MTISQKGIEVQKLVYLISDPITLIPVYIGATSTTVKERVRLHFKNENQSIEKKDWFRSLKENGLYPHVMILEEKCPEWAQLESMYICLFRSWGYDLLNKSRDSIGGAFRRKKEDNIKMSLSLKGKQQGENQRKAISEANKKRIWSEESKAKLSKAHAGRVMSQEAKSKISLSWQKRKKVSN